MRAPARAALSRRTRRDVPELGRRRVLAVLADGEVHGAEGLAEDARLTDAALWDRLHELRDASLVEWRDQVHGCSLVRLRDASGEYSGDGSRAARADASAGPGGDASRRTCTTRTTEER